MNRGPNPRRPAVVCLTLALLAAGATSWAQEQAAPPAHEHDHSHHSPPPVAKAPAAERVLGLQIPDTPVVDQEGREVRFHSDLVRGKVVAINFVFTTCTTICPPMGASFAKLRTLLGERAGRDVHLISVSVDPATDTPARLKAWSERFGAGPGWTLVTGERAQVTNLLKALGVYTASINDHSPLVLLGNDARGEWTRAYGLAAPAKLVELIDGLARAPRASQAPSGVSPSRPRSAAAAPHGSIVLAAARSASAQAPPPGPAAPGDGRTPAHRYFGDIRLVDQDGKPRRLYSDLIQGKSVVIDFMFTSCTGSCPLMSRTFERIQEALGERVGKDVHLISISVDPVNDTPTKLKEYAARFHARPGWYFLTGEKADVEEALRKLGAQVDQPEAHQNLFILGNDATGLWKKAFGLADPAEILQIVNTVVDDRG